jgi:4-hydroxy-tetrahydrodipicolinate synthase
MDDVIRGLWVAVATPLDAAGAIDREALVKHCRWLLASACDGLALFGTTGEGPSFAAGERLAAAEALLAAGIPVERMQLGTGCPAIPDTVALCRGALALGIRHLLVLPPFYFRDVTEEGLEEALAAIVEGTGSAQARFTFYHIPQVSGVPVPAKALGRLRARFGAVVAGVKDSTGDMASFRAFRAEAPDCGTVVGLEPDIARANALGGTGSINGMANVTPKLVRAMFTSADAEPAMQKACALMAGLPFAPAVKAVRAAQTGDAAWRAVRPPLRPVDAATGARIAAAIAAIEAESRA